MKATFTGNDLPPLNLEHLKAFALAIHYCGESQLLIPNEVDHQLVQHFSSTNNINISQIAGAACTFDVQQEYFKKFLPTETEDESSLKSLVLNFNATASLVLIYPATAFAQKNQKADPYELVALPVSAVPIDMFQVYQQNKSSLELEIPLEFKFKVPSFVNLTAPADEYNYSCNINLNYQSQFDFKNGVIGELKLDINQLPAACNLNGYGWSAIIKNSGFTIVIPGFFLKPTLEDKNDSKAQALKGESPFLNQFQDATQQSFIRELSCPLNSVAFQPENLTTSRNSSLLQDIQLSQSQFTHDIVLEHHVQLADKVFDFAAAAGQKLAQMFQNEDQMNLTGKKPSKTAVQNYQFKFYSEPFESFILQNVVNRRCGAVYVFISEEMRQQLSEKFEVVLQPQYSLTQKLAVVCLDPKRKLLNQGLNLKQIPATNTILAPQRQHMFTTGQAELFARPEDAKLYRLYCQIEAKDVLKITAQQFQGKNQSILPFEPKLMGEFMREQVVESRAASAKEKKAPVAAKDKKPVALDGAYVYPDGAPNNFYLNKVAGIQSLLTKLDAMKPVTSNIVVVNSASTVVQSLVKQYLENKENYEAACEVYDKLYQIVNQHAAFGFANLQLSQKVEIKLSGYFNIPIKARKLVQYTPSGRKSQAGEGIIKMDQFDLDAQFVKLSPASVQDFDYLSSFELELKETTKNQQKKMESLLGRDFELKQQDKVEENCVQQRKKVTKEISEICKIFYETLEDMYFFAVNGKGMTSGSELAKQKIMIKQTAKRQAALKGIAGQQQINSGVQQGKSVNKINFDPNAFVKQLEQSGLLELLMRKTESAFQQLCTAGFDNFGEIVNFLISNASEIAKNQIKIYAETRQQQRANRLKAIDIVEQMNDNDPSNQKSMVGGQPVLMMMRSNSFLVQQLKQIERDNDNSQLLETKTDFCKELENDLHKFSQKMLLYAASGSKYFADFVQKQSLTTLLKILNNKFLKNSSDIHEIIGQVTDELDLVDVSNIITSYLISGFRLGVPISVTTFEDAQNINKYLRKPIAFVSTLLEKPDLINATSAMLLISFYKGQSQIDGLVDGEVIINDFLQEEEIDGADDIQNSMSYTNADYKIVDEASQVSSPFRQFKAHRIANEIKGQKLSLQDVNARTNLNTEPLWEQKDIRKVAQLQTFNCLKCLLQNSPDFTGNLLYKFNLLPKDQRVIERESRAEVQERFRKGQIFSDDFQFVLDLMDFPVANNMQSRDFYNPVLFRNMKVDVDEAKKVIKNEEEIVKDARQRKLDYNLNQPAPWIVASFLYLLYKQKLMAASQIDRVLRSQLLSSFIDINDEFQDVYRPLLAGAENFANMSYSQLDNPTKNGSRTISRQGSTTDISKRNPVILALQILMKAKTDNGGRVPQKMMQQSYTATIFEYIVMQQLEIGKFIPTLENFENEDQFMDYLLDSSLPGIQEAQYKDISQVEKRVLAIVQLSEFLVLRGELTICMYASALLEFMAQQLAPTSLIVSRVQVRMSFVEFRRLISEQKFATLFNNLDNIEQTQLPDQVVAAIVDKPMFHFMKAHSLFQMNIQLMRESGTSQEDKQRIRSEIIRHLVTGTKLMRRVIDTDDYTRGSTLVGELGFFDLETAITVVETLLFNIGVEDKMLNQGHEEVLESNATQKPVEQTLNQSTMEFLSLESQEVHTDQKQVTQFLPNSSLKVHLVSVEDNSPLQTLKKKLLVEPILAPDVFAQKKKALKEFQNMSPVRDAPNQEEVASNPGYTTHLSGMSMLGTSRLAGKPKPAAQSMLETMTVYLAKQQTADTFSADELFQQHGTLLLNSAKSLLEQYPYFAPGWSYFSIIQLALGSTAEARSTSAISTLLAPELVETWVSWIACELLSIPSDSSSQVADAAEFQTQIAAMGVDGTHWSALWKVVLEAANRNALVQ